MKYQYRYGSLAWLSVGLSLALALPSLSNAQDDGDDTWVIVHAGTLLAVPGEPAENEKTIVIRNDVIESVLDGYVSPAEAGAPDAAIWSLQDSFVLPGLMDMHVHLQNGVPGLLMDDARRVFGTRVNNDAESAVIATGNAQTALRAGFTTVRDAGSNGSAVFSVRNGINSGLIDGPRIFLAGEQVHVTDGNPWEATSSTPLCDGIEPCRWMVREQIRRGADFVKIAVSGSGSEDNGGPDDPPEMFDEEIKSVVDTAPQHVADRFRACTRHGQHQRRAAQWRGLHRAWLLPRRRIHSPVP